MKPAAETTAEIGELLRASRATLAVAESCTGGGVCAALSAKAGASAWFRGGVVAYDDSLKVGLLGVDPALLAAHGAVSAPIATALAKGVRDRCAAIVGLGVTGIAGPGGGTSTKPVGLIHAAVADETGDVAASTRLVGDRGEIRAATVLWALEFLRDRLARNRP